MRQEAKFRKGPNVFLVGAPKCGTTSLYDFLCRHPAVYGPEFKEPGWYSRSRERPEFRRTNPYLESVEHYLTLYKAAPSESLVRLDGSTTYLRDPAALEEIVCDVPEAKGIAVVRDPVELVSSYYEFLRYQQWEDAPSLEAAWDRQADRARGVAPHNARRPDSLHYAEVARLGKQIRNALETFGPGNFHVVVLNDLKDHLPQISKDLQLFLGLEYKDLGSLAKLNPARKAKSDRLDRLVKNPPAWIARIRDELKRGFGTHTLGIRKQIEGVNVVAMQRQISDEMRSILRSEFSDDVDLLAQTIKRDLRKLWGWEP